jgi:hypothetical protein
MPARKPTPAPKLTTTHPTPICASILEADPDIDIPSIAVPVAIAACPLTLMPVFVISEPIDMSMPVSIDIAESIDMLMSVLPFLASPPAADVGKLSHIMVTTSSAAAAATGVAVVSAEDFLPDCARAAGAKARSVRTLRAARALACMVAGWLGGNTIRLYCRCKIVLEKIGWIEREES